MANLIFERATVIMRITDSLIRHLFESKQTFYAVVCCFLVSVGFCIHYAEMIRLEGKLDSVELKIAEVRATQVARQPMFDDIKSTVHTDLGVDNKILDKQKDLDDMQKELDTIFEYVHGQQKK